MNVGDKVPDFLGVDAEGKEIRLSDYPGKKVILYFYPKDSTSGCTAEACSMRDNLQELEKDGYQVIGVSVDSAASHQKFAAKNELTFPLIADTDHKLVEQMGVWGEKSMYGRKYMGTFRTTFIISPDGTIEKIYLPKQIKTKTHAEQILADSGANK
ncbi:thioredoxin-dependent thiol peroxidase [bacterium]|nr:thioredoxin-dependent thiol peroxidase [Bacteroidales bacterium]MBD5292485.1 thioredoxin-dependent thiol peroxidase [Bacteroides sp.]MBD5385944.1 thioredoxin-dependent thiol peroxidase [bacterium]